MSYLRMALEVYEQQQAEQDARAAIQDAAELTGGRGKSGIAEKAPSVDADTLKDHLAILYRDIRDGCRLGLHRHLERVPAEIVRSIIAAAGPDTDAETFHELCEQAGEAVLLASVIAEYRERMRLLAEMGEDVMRYATALELCLCHPAECGAP